MFEKIESLLKHEDPEVRRQALRDLQKREKNPLLSIPVFIKGLEDENWRVRKTAGEILLGISGETVIKELIRTLYQDSANARNSAIEVLIELGASATDYLIQEFKNTNVDVKKFIVDIIGKTRDLKAFPLLLKALDEEDENVKAAVVEHLGNIKKNTAVVNALISMAKSGDVWVAYHAVDALGRMGDTRAVGVLISILPQKDLRKSAITALGQIGDVGSIPSIVPFLKDETKAIREEVLKAIAQFYQRGASEEIIIQNIKSILGDEAPDVLLPHIQSAKKEVRTAAFLLSGLLKDTSVIAQLFEMSATEEMNEPVIRVLAFMGKSMPELLIPFFKADDLYQRRLVCKIAGRVGAHVFFEPLVECLKDRDGHVRGSAALALSNFDDPKAVEYIKPLMFDEYENIQEEAIMSLSKFKKWLDIKEITKGLTDKNNTVRRNTALLLGLLRDESPVSALGAALNDSDLRVKKAVVEALSAIRSPDALNFLLAALRDASPEIRRISAIAIGKMHAEEGVNALIALLADTNAWVRTAAAGALGKIGSKKAIEPLTQLLSDESELVKIAAVEALGSFKEEKVKKVLLQFLHDRDAEIRSAAAESLTVFEGVVQHIIPLLKDREWSVRKKVVDILGKCFKDESSSYLKEVADMDEDPTVREAAEGYIHA